jgi:FAD/FMN-containing dehydrogenase
MRMFQTVLMALHRILGPQGLRHGADIGERYRSDPIGNQGQTPLAVARPRSTAEVSQLLAVCNGAGVPGVTQGGRSGQVLSCLPRAGELVLSTERMNEVEAVDPEDCTATVQAGVVLQAPQEQEQEQERSGRAAWMPLHPRPRQVSTALRAYALLATSADRGTVRDLSRFS